MPLFCGDYIADTKHLTLEEHGAYLMLLMLSWRSPDGVLDDDDRRLARMLGVTERRWQSQLRPVVETFFTIIDGKWTQKRLIVERKYVEERRLQKSQAGKASALKRQQTTSTDVPVPSQQNGQRKGNPQPQPLKEGPEAKASEGVPPDENLLDRPAHVAPDLKGTVFGECLSALAAWLDKPPDGLRSLLGRWCRDHGEARVIAAFGTVDLRAEGVPDDPVAWLENWFRTRALTPGDADVVGKSQPALLAWRGRMLREIERRRGNEEAERIGDAVTRGEKWATDALYAIDRQMKGAGT